MTADIIGALEIAHLDLHKHGSKIGNTTEYPLNIDISMNFCNIVECINLLKTYVPQKVMELEAVEYEHLQKQAVGVCLREFFRDRNSRRAVVNHPGCITYQHFMLRDNALIYVVHMRGIDTWKAAADIEQFLWTAIAIREHCIPEQNLKPMKPDMLMLSIIIDSYHCYYDEGNHAFNL